MERETNESPAPRAARVDLLMAVARDTAASLQLVSSQLRAELAAAPAASAPVADLEAVLRAETALRAAVALRAEVDQLRAEADQLRQALASRAVIEQAKGVLMARCGCDADTAFAMLCTVSRTERRKVRDVATDLVAAAVAPPSLVGTRTT